MKEKTYQAIYKAKKRKVPLKVLKWTCAQKKDRPRKEKSYIHNEIIHYIKPKADIISCSKEFLYEKVYSSWIQANNSTLRINSDFQMNRKIKCIVTHTVHMH